LIKRTLKLLEDIERLLEFTEEPDAFETQTERELAKEWEKDNDKKHLLQGYKDVQLREALLSNLKMFFSKFKFIRDLQRIGDRLQFWIPEDKLVWFNEWRGNSNALKQGKLKAFPYNSSEGYIIEIQ